MASRSNRAVPDTHQKALAVNLDATSFGSFAEIGAGQEVARWFLRVGGASGTVAKTISAYDKEVSDDLYGSGTRYVSKPRLQAMLESEWASLLKQVGDTRSASTRFFSFADTVAARNFAGTNDCHGWLGVRFQDRPGADASEIVLHVNLRDSANLPQQEAVGVLGVNLLHALLIEPATADDLPARLFDDIDAGRVEIDEIVTGGPAFRGWDMRELHMALARDGRADVVTLAADGTAQAANEFLYKKAVVIATAVGDHRIDLSPAAIAACADALRAEVAGDAEVKEVIDVRLVIADPQSPTPAPDDALTDRPMLVTRHRALFATSAFLRRYTRAKLRFAVTLPTLVRVFDEARYEKLEGRMLEGVARLFGHNVRVLVAPCPRERLAHLLTSEPECGWSADGDGDWVTADQLHPAPPLRHLYDYLLASGFLVSAPA